MKKAILILTIWTSFSITLLGQGEIQKDFSARKDQVSYGAILNSNGWALDYKKAFWRNRRYRNFYEAGISKLRDEKEIKQMNLYNLDGNRIYYGKVNDVTNLYFGIGREKTITENFDQKSIAIKMIHSFGGQIAVIKPVYYEIFVTENITDFTKYVPTMQISDIANMAPYYYGLNEIKLSPGAYLKIGISFEQQAKKSRLNMLETGVVFNAYLLPIEIMYQTPKKQFFAHLFLSFRFGKSTKSQPGKLKIFVNKKL